MNSGQATAHRIPGPITAYLAAAAEWRYYTRELRTKLHAQGLVCASQWLDDVEDQGELSQALTRLEDLVRTAHVFVLYNERSVGRPSNGSEHVEFGIAAVLQKPIVLIGERSNVFQWLPSVQVVPAIASPARLAAIITMAAVHGTPIPHEVLMAPI